MKLLLNIILSLIILAGCSDKCPVSAPDGDYLVFGSFYGMCAGEICIEIFKYENNILYEDGADIYPSSEEMPYKGNYYIIDNKYPDDIDYLLSHFPGELLSSGQRTFGIPDGHDQGGLILQVKKDGIVKQWLIDMQTTWLPEYLKNYAEKLKLVLNKLRD